MDTLPEGLTAYRRTAEFNQDTLPAGLQKEHRTKAGTWALIHVLEGRLLYRILDPISETILLPGTPGVVRPEQPHEVHPDGPVRLYVEFYAEAPAAAPHD